MAATISLLAGLISIIVGPNGEGFISIIVGPNGEGFISVVVGLAGGLISIIVGADEALPAAPEEGGALGCGLAEAAGAPGGAEDCANPLAT